MENFNVDSASSAWNSSRGSILSAVLVIALVSLTFRYGYGRKEDPREPPVVAPKIPFIGHLISMIRDPDYFQTLRKTVKYPIFSLPLLTSRMYVVTSAQMAAVLQRSSKAVSFTPLVILATQRIADCDDESLAILQRNSEGEKTEPNLLSELHDMLYDTLTSAEGLEEVSTATLNSLADYINDFLSDGQESSSFELAAKLRHIFTFSASRGLYGPENIFDADPSLEKSFWDFDNSFLAVVSGILPKILVRKAYAGRQRLIDAFGKYEEQGRYAKGSQLIQRRTALQSSRGISLATIGRFEVSVTFAMLTNATPTANWLILEIFSRPDLLSEIRDELESAKPWRLVRDDDTGKEVCVLRTNALKECRLLVSCYRETLRTRAPLPSNRFVTEDTLVADKYFLRANSVVQMASGVLHNDPDTWGSDVHEFNPHRFYHHSTGTFTTEKNASSQTKKAVPPAAFRPFGGGAVYCPGRFFAQNELVGFTAALVLGFEIRGKDGWTVVIPEEQPTYPISVRKPAVDVNVRISKREGWDRYLWRFEP